MDGETLRRLVIKPFSINNVEFGNRFAIKDHKLEIVHEKINDLKKADSIITDIKLEIIKPGDYDREINTIMDVIPVSTKVLGTLGEGITHTLTGVYVMLTGVDEDGRQMHEFGSSEGILSEQMIFGRRGTPSEDDFIIHMDVTVQGGLPFDRTLPNACFKACDDFIQEIRNILKSMDGRMSDSSFEYLDKSGNNKPKVVLIKQIAGQGAMYDNLLFPDEPSGFEGGTSIIDMCSMPMILSPNECRDGILRALV